MAFLLRYDGEVLVLQRIQEAILQMNEPVPFQLMPLVQFSQLWVHPAPLQSGLVKDRDLHFGDIFSFQVVSTSEALDFAFDQDCADLLTLLLLQGDVRIGRKVHCRRRAALAK